MKALRPPIFPTRWPIRNPPIRGLVQPMTLPNGVKTRTVGCPVWMNPAPVAVSTDVPALNAHDAALRQRSRTLLGKR